MGYTGPVRPAKFSTGVMEILTRFATSAGSTSTHLNTPFKNPRNEPAQEIEVTDPTHPLFGRRFPLLSMFAPRHSPGRVLVAYRDQLVLSIPLLATSIAPPRPTHPTKLTSQAVTELISLAEQYGVPSCPTDLTTAGNACRHSSKPKSSRTLQRSSRR
jgi:hypothetical protein